eukprot:CAMPEP_0118894680 /NCGR_PEP_ID=MMETSP1166-20130328/3354_1 /TAXON_ID=1104430 /ORGANISM="Chrysoreinhardia sp, Strain CCMP3193" /LENGTH=487 /DNA_ID=CAMNT_0006833619 /DNA_START=572 /DNA_END=2035 /DNA_ORIENTATION=-
MAQEVFLAVLSKVTFTCSHVLGKSAPDERLVEQHMRRPTALGDSDGRPDFTTLWEKLLESFEVVEYFNSVVALRDELAMSEEPPKHEMVYETPGEGSRSAIRINPRNSMRFEDATAADVRCRGTRPYLSSSQVDNAISQWWAVATSLCAISGSALRQLTSQRNSFQLFRSGTVAGFIGFETLFASLFEEVTLKLSRSSSSPHFGADRIHAGEAESLPFRAEITKSICRVMDASLSCSPHTHTLVKGNSIFRLLELGAMGHGTLPIVHTDATSTDELACVAGRTECLRILHRAPRLLGAVWFRPLIQFHQVIRKPLVLPPSATVWRALEVLNKSREGSIAIASHRPAVYLGAFSYETWRQWLELKLDPPQHRTNDHWALELQSNNGQGSSPPSISQRGSGRCVDYACSAIAEGLLAPIITVARNTTEPKRSAVMCADQPLHDAVQTILHTSIHADRLHLVGSGQRSNMFLVGSILVTDVLRFALSEAA